MDKPVLVIEAPELSDEAAAVVRDFLFDLVNAFESHYYHKRKRYYQQSENRKCSHESPEEQEPF